MPATNAVATSSWVPRDDSDPRPLKLRLAEHEALAAAAAASRLSRSRVGPATVPASSDELLEATAEQLRDSPRLHVHLREVREEVTASRTGRGMGSIWYAGRVRLTGQVA